jgi:hypothetical protein
MYKIGDKVEYCGLVSTVVSINERQRVMGIVYTQEEEQSAVVGFDSVKPYRTAHEKLIEMGYEHSEYSYGDVYELKESYKYNGLSGRIQTDNYGAINCGDVYIGLELSRILTQYLEEMK